MQLLAIFNYPFMLRAFAAGIVVAIIAPLIGTFLFTKRYSLIADTLAHVSLAGVALGFLLGVYPLLSAIVVTVAAAIVIEKLRRDQQLPGEAALAMFLSGGLALAVTLMSIAKGLTADVLSYLFGSITTVSSLDLLLISLLGIGVIVVIVLFYKEFLYTVFDEDAGQIAGLPTRQFNIALMVLTALTVALSMRVVGVLLIGALMVIPVLTATQFARSFKRTVWWAMCLSFVAVVLGLIASYYLNIVAGGAIVICALLEFVFVSLLKK